MVNEIFASLQGEGVRAGTMNFFVRFSFCNMKCDYDAGPLSPGGWACDSEFTSGRKMSADEIVAECKRLSPKCTSVIFTGGEPLLQLDKELLQCFVAAGIAETCIETNGTIDPSELRKEGLSWITLSPKVAEHCIKVKECDEIKYVRHHGQGIPVTKVEARHKLISPAFPLTQETLSWCIQMIKDNPEWRMSMQLHKFWKVR